MPENRDYFKVPDNIHRVQQWRADNQGYWKRHPSRCRGALQDVLSLQPVENKANVPYLNSGVLQDVCSVQPALLIGLIASLTGSTLQDVIAETTRRFIISGRDILGIGLEHKPKGGIRYGAKTHSFSGSSSPNSPAVQLGGSSPGAG